MTAAPPDAATLAFDDYIDAVHTFLCVPSASLTSSHVFAFLQRVNLATLLSVLGADAVQQRVRDDTVLAIERVVGDVLGREALFALEHAAIVVQKGLLHADAAVQAASARILAKLLQAAEPQEVCKINALIGADAVISSLISLLTHEAPNISEAAADVLIQFGRCGDSCINILFSSAVAEKLQSIVSSDEGHVFGVRVLSLCARLSGLSEHAFLSCQQYSFLNQIIELISSSRDDVLMQMTAFRLVVEVAQSRRGIEFLSDLPFSSVAAEFGSHASDYYLTCCVLKTLESIVDSSIKHSVTEWITQKPLVEFINVCINSDDESIVESAIGTVCSFACCEEGLRQFHNVLVHVSQLCCSDASVALKTAALHGLASVLEARDSLSKHSGSGASIDEIHRSILDNQSQKLYSLTASMSKLLSSPEQDLRVAVYRFLNEMANTRYGGQEIVQSANLLDRLMDRDAEFDSLLVQWQFSVLQRLSVNNDCLIEHLSERRRKMLLEHVHLGPFLRQQETQVRTV